MTRKLVIGCFLVVSGIRSGIGQEITPEDTLDLRMAEVVDFRGQPDPVFRTLHLDSSKLVAYQLVGLDNLLQEQSALFVRNYGPGALSSPSFRGTNASHTKVFWNGIEVNSPFLGQSDLALVPVFGLDAVDIHHGNASVSDGFGGIGGSVRLRSEAKHPRGIAIQQGIGSYGFLQTAGRVSWQGSRWHSTTRAMWRRAENDFPYLDITETEPAEHNRENAGFEQFQVQQDFRYSLSEDQSLEVHAAYVTAQRDIPTPITTPNQDEHQGDDWLAVAATWSWKHQRHLLHVTSGLVYQELLFENPTTDLRSLSLSTGFKNQWRWKTLWTERFTTSATLFWEFDRGTYSSPHRQETLAKQALLVTADYRMAPRWTVYAHLKPTRAQDQVEPLLPAIGFRSSWWKDQLSWSANVSQNFNFPTLNDLYWQPGGNPDLRPEGGWTGETSLHLKRTAARTTFETTVTAYYSQIDDFIQWTPSDASYWVPENLKTVENFGIESDATLRWHWGDWYYAFGAQYQWTRSQTTEAIPELSNTLDKQLPYVPEHQVSWNGSAAFMGWRAGVIYEFVGQRYIESDHSSLLPSYELTHVFASKAWELSNAHRLDLNLRVNNLFDADYMNLAWRPMPGIWYQCSVQYTLGL